MNEIRTMAQGNLDRLRESEYPGRGIVLGATPSGKELVQVYWTMGRSQGSKNRMMIRDGGDIKTIPHDKSLEVQHEDLLMYTAATAAGNTHVVTNGRQTDTIAEYLKKGSSFEEALYQWEFEHDPPIYTSRISGSSVCDGKASGYKLGIIKALEQKPELLTHQFFSYSAVLPGFGHCIHTYSLTETCKPFSGEPYWVSLFDDLDENAEYYWNILPNDKRVALYIKHVDIATGAVKDKIFNIH
jgi:hypothetical protein